MSFASHSRGHQPTFDVDPLKFPSHVEPGIHDIYKAAGLVPYVYCGNDIFFLMGLERRSDQSLCLSLGGGKRDTTDRTSLHTALREFEEESDHILGSSLGLDNVWHPNQTTPYPESQFSYYWPGGKYVVHLICCGEVQFPPTQQNSSPRDTYINKLWNWSNTLLLGGKSSLVYPNMTSSLVYKHYRTLNKSYIEKSFIAAYTALSNIYKTICASLDDNNNNNGENDGDHDDSDENGDDDNSNKNIPNMYQWLQLITHVLPRITFPQFPYGHIGLEYYPPPRGLGVLSSPSLLSSLYDMMSSLTLSSSSTTNDNSRSIPHHITPPHSQRASDMLSNIQQSWRHVPSHTRDMSCTARSLLFWMLPLFHYSKHSHPIVAFEKTINNMKEQTQKAIESGKGHEISSNMYVSIKDDVMLSRALHPFSAWPPLGLVTDLESNTNSFYAFKAMYSNIRTLFENRKAIYGKMEAYKADVLEYRKLTTPSHAPLAPPPPPPDSSFFSRDGRGGRGGRGGSQGGGHVGSQGGGHGRYQRSGRDGYQGSGHGRYQGGPDGSRGSGPDGSRGSDGYQGSGHGRYQGGPDGSRGSGRDGSRGSGRDGYQGSVHGRYQGSRDDSQGSGHGGSQGSGRGGYQGGRGGHQGRRRDRDRGDPRTSDDRCLINPLKSFFARYTKLYSRAITCALFPWAITPLKSVNREMQPFNSDDINTYGIPLPSPSSIKPHPFESYLTSLDVTISRDDIEMELFNTNNKDNVHKNTYTYYNDDTNVLSSHSDEPIYSILDNPQQLQAIAKDQKEQFKKAHNIKLTEDKSIEYFPSDSLNGTCLDINSKRKAEVSHNSEASLSHSTVDLDSSSKAFSTGFDSMISLHWVSASHFLPSTAGNREGQYFSDNDHKEAFNKYVYSLENLPWQNNDITSDVWLTSTGFAFPLGNVVSRISKDQGFTCLVQKMYLLRHLSSQSK